MGKILIIGDMHGRRFWKDACLNHKDEFEKIVFLGDYVSPYCVEGITNGGAISVFGEVLNFKKENPEKVVLLIGNHDLSYFNSSICECRTDWKNWDRLNGIYFDNIKSFDLAWETKIGGKRYFFSHAGVRKSWLDNWVSGRLFDWNGDELPPADKFNKLFHNAYDDAQNIDLETTHAFERALGVYSTYRGRYGWAYGSIVWADIEEYEAGPEYNDVVFVCGHTQLEEEPIIEKWVMDLDCRKPFILDTETGKVEEYK